MLKIVYRVCCGMDVHKSFVVACIASTNEQGVTAYKSKRFSTFTGDLRRCAAWLSENNCKDVCMESTGKYWIPIYNILERTCNIVLAHPKYVKAIRGKKTDKRDAKWIADIFKHDLVAGSFIPPADIRQLRDLFRYRWKLTNFATGEKNRAQNCLTVSNFKLDDVFSDVFGKAASAITARILKNPSEKITDVSGFRTKRMKATDEEILAAVDGEMCAEQAEKLRIIRSHMDSLELCKLNLESLILSTAEKYLPQLELVMTAPGIQSFAAIGIISEIGVDMSVFPTSKHLCSWAGLTPQNNESAGKKKTTRISRAGAYIKPLLVQCALCAVRAKQFPEVPDCLPGVFLVHIIEIPEALCQRRSDHTAEVLVVFLLNALTVQRMAHAGGDPFCGIGDGPVQVEQNSFDLSHRYVSFFCVVGSGAIAAL